MAKLINAPYAKQQDPTGQSLVTICIGTQAQVIAKHFNEMDKSAVEIELENALGEQGKSFPCVVVDSEILEQIESYRIAPKNTQSIRLIQANNGVALSNETLERIYLNIVQSTTAESVIYCNEAGEVLDDVSRYIQRLRNGETYHGNIKEVDECYAKMFDHLSDNLKVRDFLAWTGETLKVDSVNTLAYLWTGKKWQFLTDKKLGREVKRFFEEKEIGYSKRKIENMVGLMLDYYLEPMGERRKNLLAFSNGVLDTKTGEFLPHSPDYYLTSYIDIDYSETPIFTPNFDKWLDWVSGNDERKAKRILAALYMVLTNRYDWQLFLEITGVGGSGKSIFNELAKMLVGADNTASITLKELENINHRAKLIDKTLIYSSDQENYIGDGAELRAITGGDTISVRLLYRDPFDTTINAVYMMTNNKSATFKEHNGGIARRRVIYHFNKAVPESMIDTKLVDKLLSESAGIVRLLLDTFKDPKEARALLLEQRESMEALEVKQKADHILDFCRHFTAREEMNGLYMGNARAQIKNAERQYLYASYLFYCDCMGINKPLGRSRFLDSFRQATKESKYPHEFKKRLKDGKNVTNIYYINIGQTMAEWQE